MTHNTPPTIGQLIERRLNRRDALRGLGTAGVFAAAGPALAQSTGPSSLTFKELSHTLDATQHVAEGYDMQVVIRWGDPVVAGAPAFDPGNLTAAADEVEHEGANIAVFLEVVNCGDIGMVQRREDLRFAPKALQAIPIGGELLRQKIQRDVAIQLGIRCAIDLSHSTVT